MTDDDIIEELLNDLYKSKTPSFVNSTLKRLGLKMNLAPKFRDRLISKGLASLFTRSGSLIIEDFGRHIYESGGWLKHIESLNEKNEEQKNIDKIKLKKLISEEKLSRWQVKTFWWFFGLSILGGLVGIRTVILEIKDKYYTEPQEQREKDQEKKEPIYNEREITEIDKPQLDTLKTNDTFAN